MRYVTLRISGDGGRIQQLPATAVPPDVERGPIDQLELLADGSVVQIRAVQGDLATYRDLLADTEGVHAFSVTGDREGYVFAHFEPTERGRALLEWRRAVPVVVPLPIEFDHEDVLVTLVGDDDGITAAIDALPASVDYEVSETGQFTPLWATPFRGLTDRQQEILATAIECGYYENPREVTQAEVADALSLSPGTVGDHLRTIESHVFSRAAAALGTH